MMTKPEQSPHRTALRGFTLVSTMVGMAMLAVIGYVVVKEVNRYVVERAAERIYSGYHGLDDGLNRYVQQHFREMIGNSPISGVASAWVPTLSELKNLGYIDGFVRTKFTDIGQLSYKISVLPAGCTLTSAQCNIEYVIQPEKGVANETVAAIVLKRLGPSGMVNDVTNVNLARAWDGVRTMPSPVPVKNALFVSRVFPSSLLAAALPLDGSRPMTGNWDTGTKKLTGVGVFSTNTFTFAEVVTEGDSCTNTPGYKTLAMGSNHYVQICKTCPTGTGTCWVHANEDLTIVKNTVIHTAPPGGWGSGGSGGSGGHPGWVGSDGRLYSDPYQNNVCNDCNRPDGTTYQYDAANGTGNGNGNGSGGSGCTSSCAGGGVNPSAPPYTTNPSVGPGSGGSGNSGDSSGDSSGGD